MYRQVRPGYDRCFAARNGKSIRMVYADASSRYLLYSVAGESGIAVATLHEDV